MHGLVQAITRLSKLHSFFLHLRLLLEKISNCLGHTMDHLWMVGYISYFLTQSSYHLSYQEENGGKFKERFEEK